MIRSSIPKSIRFTASNALLSALTRIAAAALVLGSLLLAGCGGTTLSGTVGGVVAGSAASNSQPVALERQYIAVVKRTEPEVAQIQTDSGLGSGVIFDRQGDIVTNAHVVEGATALEVTLADGRHFKARLVGSYVPDDLAVISIGAGHKLTPATLADSSKVAAGDIVLAVGNPLGLQSSVTDGIVSATGRTVSEGNGVVLPNSIQTSAPINPGNSGGALVDLDSRVIGIPTLAAGSPMGGAATGIGFAIPSNIVRDIAGQLISKGHVANSHRAALGVSIADNLASPGAVITALQAGGPAAKAGLAVGDSIESIGGKQVTSADDLATILAGYQPGQKVRLSYRRTNGSISTTTITLGQLPGT